MTDTAKENEDDEKEWTSIRNEFMRPAEEVYLNTGSFGVMPRPVWNQFQEDLAMLERNPTRVRRTYSAALDDVRHDLGRFLNVPGEDVALATNVTTAMNMVYLGMDWNTGDEILASDHEYGAINNILHYVSRRHGVTINRASIPRPPANDNEVVASFAEAITDRTRLILCSHIATDTGLILPLRQLSELAHERDILIAVDGAHGPGMLPLDLAETGCDFYGGNCHKWLCAPKGTGILYAHKDRQCLLNPTQVSWGYQPEGPRAEGDRLTIRNRPFMWELEVVGTRDLACFTAIPAAIAFQEAIGRERILGRYRQLAGHIRKRLLDSGWCDLLTPVDPMLGAGISAFHLHGFGEQDLDGRLYDEYRITVRAELRRRDLHWMRVSSHICNSFGELDVLTEALTRIRHSPAGRQ